MIIFKSGLIKSQFIKKLSKHQFHECHAVTTRTMNTTWWPWDSHGEIKRFPLGECPIWPAPHHKRFLVVSPWRSLCYHEESRGLTMRFFWSPREIFWWIKIFTYPPTKSFLVVSPWDSLCHHKESHGLTARIRQRQEIVWYGGRPDKQFSVMTCI